MHSDRALRFQIQSSRWQMRFVLLCALTSIACLFTLQTHGVSTTEMLTLSIFTIFLTGFVALKTIQPHPFELQFDGENWYWSGFAEEKCRATCLIDLQFCMLIGIESIDSGVIFRRRFWVDRADFGRFKWLLLRRALWSN